MFALNLIRLPRMLAFGILLIAIIVASLALVDSASANTYGYYWRP